MYTVGRLAGLCGLSRSALLYYDSIGILSPSGYSPSGYRLYSESDRKRLERVLALKDAGLPLQKIRAVLDTPGESPTALLLERVFEINSKIRDLRIQQSLLLGFLEADGSLKGTKDILHTLTELGKRAGVRSDNYLALHRLFEESSPDEHRRLLRHLGFTEEDIRVFMDSIIKNI